MIHFIIYLLLVQGIFFDFLLKQWQVHQVGSYYSARAVETTFLAEDLKADKSQWF